MDRALRASPALTGLLTSLCLLGVKSLACPGCDLYLTGNATGVRIGSGMAAKSEFKLMRSPSMGPDTRQ